MRYEAILTVSVIMLGSAMAGEGKVPEKTKSSNVAVSTNQAAAKPEVKDFNGWHTDFANAKQTAKQKKQLILADFSGSDWCGWCIKLEKEVFSQEIFKNWAKDNVVLFIADFPRAVAQPDNLKKQNQDLMQKYGVEGFPSVLILDADGNLIHQTGYMKGGAQVYVDKLQELIAKSAK